MVAPIDAKVTFEAEGETIALRLNFRTMALAEAQDIDITSGVPLKPTRVAVLLRCLASVDQPDMSDEEAFGLFLGHGEAAGKAITALFEQFGAMVKPGGKPKGGAKGEG